MLSDAVSKRLVGGARALVAAVAVVGAQVVSQAAWAAHRHARGDALYGLPSDLDPLEGWIVTA